MHDIFSNEFNGCNGRIGGMSFVAPLEDHHAKYICPQ